MSSPEPDAPVAEDPTRTSAESVRKALKAYRILAWATGIWLIALCAEMVLKYIVKVDWPLLWIVAPIHGWIYFAYLLSAANLATKVRWPSSQRLARIQATAGEMGH